MPEVAQLLLIYLSPGETYFVLKKLLASSESILIDSKESEKLGWFFPIH